MTDEAFYLTPLDVRRYDFGTALRGYDKARVDQFREQVADELERLTRVNQELEQKARGFHEQLRAFRERDKALNDALISAQQLRADLRDQSEREAQLVLREARAEGEQIVAAARADVQRMANELAALERARRAYIAQMRAMLERQMADLAAAESGTAVAALPEDQAVAGGNGEPPKASSSRPTPSWLDTLVNE